MKVFKLTVLFCLTLTLASCGGQVNVKRKTNSNDTAKQTKDVDVNGETATIVQGCESETLDIQCGSKVDVYDVAEYKDYKNFYNTCSRNEEGYAFEHMGACSTVDKLDSSDYLDTNDNSNSQTFVPGYEGV